MMREGDYRNYKIILIEKIQILDEKKAAMKIIMRYWKTWLIIIRVTTLIV
ncbi:hypothetical protein NRK67_00700 [Fusobacteria bacterium ZRK30]|nr:hypothetical protein NRK67_00700 [Fusobacteria bacterium ZRK30]